MELNFQPVWENSSALASGLAATLALTVNSALIGIAVGIIGAAAKMYGNRPIRMLVSGYVELIRNTPFLVQLFIVYFGLPYLDIRMSASSAALLALSVNFGAYTTEIVRAGLEAIPKGQTEAGLALGLSRLDIFRYIVIIPALRVVFPAVTSQFILMMLQTSVVSAIAAHDLMTVANHIQSTTFITYETYITLAIIYLALTIVFGLVFKVLFKTLFKYPLAR